MSELSLLDRVRRRLRRHLADPLERRIWARIRRQRNAEREYRPVFIGGASGSGTSLLSVSLGQQFDCAGIIYESNFQVGSESFLYVPGIDDFSSIDDYRQHMTPRHTWSIEQGRQDMLEMYRSYGWGPSNIIIDKGPDTNLLRVDYLHRCFPEAPFVLIFRDPVANLEGLRRKWALFGDAPLEESTRFYQIIHECFLTSAAALPESTFAVEYEVLVEDPDGVLNKLGRRLGLAPARRRRRLSTYPNVEGRGVRNVRKSKIGVVKDAN